MIKINAMIHFLRLLIQLLMLLQVLKELLCLISIQACQQIEQFIVNYFQTAFNWLFFICSFCWTSTSGNRSSISCWSNGLQSNWYDKTYWRTSSNWCDGKWKYNYIPKKEIKYYSWIDSNTKRVSIDFRMLYRLSLFKMPQWRIVLKSHGNLLIV